MLSFLFLLSVEFSVLSFLVLSFHVLSFPYPEKSKFEDTLNASPAFYFKMRKLTLISMTENALSRAKKFFHLSIFFVFVGSII